MADRTNYQAWDITNQTAEIGVLTEQLKAYYQNDIAFPANTKADAEKRFAPSHLYWSDSDLYYSANPIYEDEYLYAFLEEDERAPFRGNYKRTEVGLMFPELLKDHDGIKPGESLVTPKGFPPPIYQDETAPIKDWRARNLVDFHYLDYAQNFNDFQSYEKIKDAVLNAIIGGNELLKKCMVDAFIVGVLGNWHYSYPSGHPLYRFFAENDEYVPEEKFSKPGRLFYLKDQPVKQQMEEIMKYARKYYVNRSTYLTNINRLEIGNHNPSKDIPKWKERLMDMSTGEKALESIRDLYLEKDDQSKYTKVADRFRRPSLRSLAGHIGFIIDRMCRYDSSNWCGHNAHEDNKAKEALTLRSRPENIIVLLNKSDLRDIKSELGSSTTGDISFDFRLRDFFSEFQRKGVRFFPVDYILPSMAIILDKKCFRGVQYFNAKYENFFSYHVTESVVEHLYIKPCLYRYVNCVVVQPAKGQKYALPTDWASEYLPFFRDNS